MKNIYEEYYEVSSEKEEVLKWNFKTKKYRPYKFPYKATSLACCPIYEVITCAGCGKKILCRDGYISRKIHTVSGMGYFVCKRCHDKECKEENKYQEYKKSSIGDFLLYK